MAWFVYILRCKDNSLYVGSTTDPDRRVSEHNDSQYGSKFVRARRPAVLVYKEACADKSSALKRELEIKRWNKKKKLLLIDKH